MLRLLIVRFVLEIDVRKWKQQLARVMSNTNALKRKQ